MLIEPELIFVVSLTRHIAGFAVSEAFTLCCLVGKQPDAFLIGGVWHFPELRRIRYDLVY